MIFLDLSISTLPCEFANHRDGSQLIIVVENTCEQVILDSLSEIWKKCWFGESENVARQALIDMSTDWMNGPKNPSQNGIAFKDLWSG